MNIGYSSRLPYDDCYYQARLKQSTDPVNYRINGNQIDNCNRCLSTLGPRSSVMGFGVSTVRDVGVAPAQDLIDLDSVLSNRNVKESSCITGHFNTVNPTTWKNNDQQICNNFLNPETSRLSYPARTYRSMNINRFYNLPNDPQKPIFYNFALDTRLEAKDNFDPEIPDIWPDNMNPNQVKNGSNCGGSCPKNPKCSTNWGFKAVADNKYYPKCQ
jgi:hypothetical protein